MQTHSLCNKGNTKDGGPKQNKAQVLTRHQKIIITSLHYHSTACLCKINVFSIMHGTMHIIRHVARDEPLCM